MYRSKMPLALSTYYDTEKKVTTTNWKSFFLMSYIPNSFSFARKFLLEFLRNAHCCYCCPPFRFAQILISRCRILQKLRLLCTQLWSTCRLASVKYDSTFEETRQYFLTTFCMLQYNFRGFAARWIINKTSSSSWITTNYKLGNKPIFRLMMIIKRN